MGYRTRIGILIGFVVLFLITAPLVILYTAGYRWNEKKFRLEKVGIIFLRSRPSGADIYLNGKLRRETTPTRLRNLLPDTYEVKVTKPGYTSWSKKLNVESALATFAEGVMLWKNTKPEKISLPMDAALTNDELAEIVRPDPLAFTVGKTSFKSNGFEIWTETENNQHETVTRLSQEIRAIMPYDDIGWVIYETGSEIHAIERDGRDMKNDITLVSGGNDLNSLAVSSDGKTLYYLSGTGAAAELWKLQLQ